LIYCCFSSLPQRRHDLARSARARHWSPRSTGYARRLLVLA
jgi:hypothetical protein